ncbi:MAG: serine/threonine protein kinase [Myxococcales bacterium]|nr:serine/threonine protein kinase [Myxococcales bacterium]
MSALDALIGQVIGGRYRIERLLGKGGFGAVFEATHLELQRPVAVKVLLASAQEGDALLARFRREARLQDELRHPAIVKLRDFGRREEDGLCFMVQEFVDGRTLDALVADGPVAPQRAIRLVCGVLEGLAEAHWRGIVHRDLKPANIMVVEGPDEEEVRILDFGIAKAGDLGEESVAITQTGQLLGTPAFMAPEQIEGQRVTAAADLYAMGVVLFVLLTGRRPFVGSLQAVLTAHLVRPVPALPAGLPVGLGAVVACAMAKDPGDRFASAGEMRGALLGVLGGAEEAGAEDSAGGAARGAAPAVERARSGRGAETGSLDETAVTPTPSSSWREAVVSGEWTDAEGAGGVERSAPRDGRSVPWWDRSTAESERPAGNGGAVGDSAARASGWATVTEGSGGEEDTSVDVSGDGSDQRRAVTGGDGAAEGAAVVGGGGGEGAVEGEAASAGAEVATAVDAAAVWRPEVAGWAAAGRAPGGVKAASGWWVVGWVVAVGVLAGAGVTWWMVGGGERASERVADGGVDGSSAVDGGADGGAGRDGGQRDAGGGEASAGEVVVVGQDARPRTRPPPPPGALPPAERLRVLEARFARAIHGCEWDAAQRALEEIERITPEKVAELRTQLHRAQVSQVGCE